MWSIYKYINRPWTSLWLRDWRPCCRVKVLPVGVHLVLGVHGSWQVRLLTSEDSCCGLGGMGMGYWRDNGEHVALKPFTAAAYLPPSFLPQNW